LLRFAPSHEPESTIFIMILNLRGRPLAARRQKIQGVVYDAVMKRIPSKRLLLTGLFMLAAVLLEFGWLHLFSPLEHRLADAMIRLHARTPDASPEIVIVDIDERSLAALAATAGRWPWPRAVHAELLEGLERQHPRAVVFDILFSDADLACQAADNYFDDVIRTTGNTYFPMLRLNDTDDRKGIPLAKYGAMLGIAPGADARPDARAAMVLPLAVMVESGRVGVHNAVSDADGVVRSSPIFLEVAGWRIPSLPARLAAGMGWRVPAQQNIVLNWHGPAYSYRRISYADVYQDLQRRHPLRPPGEFANKIVIIGTTATGLHDIRATPMDGFFPGVEILATAIDNLQRGDSLRRVPVWGAPLLALLLLVAVYGAYLRWRHPLRIAYGLVPASLLLLGLSYAALGMRLLLPVLTPLIFVWLYYVVSALGEYLAERRARERAIETFGRFLDPRVVKALVESGATAKSMSGHSREVTVLFSDIRGFTTMSEASTPEQIVDLLNRYFTLQVEAIFVHGGTLDKYIGDAIMAFWGAPAEQPDHALRAVAAALAMSAELEKFRATAGELGRDLEIGIGIHSGPAVVGFIGSANRQDYTAIGDTVNLASRIEGQTKGISRILVSEDTVRLCAAQAGPQGCPYEFIAHGSYKVKGRVQEVKLFEPRKKT
jgi:adenylate cyclase